jgi:hypothetical protein
MFICENSSHLTSQLCKVELDQIENFKMASKSDSKSIASPHYHISTIVTLVIYLHEPNPIYSVRCDEGRAGPNYLEARRQKLKMKFL